MTVLFKKLRVEMMTVISYTILLNILISLYFIFEIDLTDFQRSFNYQLVFSLIISSLLSIFCILFPKFKVFFLVKYFFIMVILYPLSKYIFFNLIINFEFILLVILIQNYPFGTIASIIAILFQLILKPENIMGIIENESNTKVHSF